MPRYYFIIIILSVIVLATLGYGFSLVGSPFDSAKREADKSSLQEITTAARNVFDYYTGNKILPKTLAEAQGFRVIVTSGGKPIDYRITGKDTFELCIDLQVSRKGTLRLDQQIFNSSTLYNVSSNLYQYSSGLNCLKFQAKDTYSNTYYPTPTPVKKATSLFEDFEIWNGATPDRWGSMYGRATKSSKAFSRQSAMEFSGIGRTIVVSPALQPGDDAKITLSFQHETASKCKNCLIAGFHIINNKNMVVMKDVEKCGTFDPDLKVWLIPVIGPTKGFETFEASCTLPKDTDRYQVLLGNWNGNTSPWTIDYLNIKPENSTTPSATTTSYILH